MYLENFSNVLTLWGRHNKGRSTGRTYCSWQAFKYLDNLRVCIQVRVISNCSAYSQNIVVKHFTCNYQFDLCASVLFDFSRIVQTLRLGWTARYRFGTRDTWIPWERHNNHTPRVSGNLSSHSATLFCLCAFVIVVVLVIFIVNVFAYLRRPHKYHVKSNNNNNNRNRWSVEQEKKQQNEQ